MLLRSSFNRDLRRFHAVKEVLYNSGRTEAALPPLLTADHLHRDLSPCSRALPLSAQMSFSKRSSDRKVEPQLWNQPLYVVTRNQLLFLYFKLKRIWMRIFPPFVRFHGDTVLDWGRSWVCQCPKYTRVGCKWERPRGCNDSRTGPALVSQSLVRNLSSLCIWQVDAPWPPSLLCISPAHTWAHVSQCVETTAG